jgi:dihydroxy-acid dehydratase
MAQHYDGTISVPACDKNMPGCFMAAVRHNRPTIIIYGGRTSLPLEGLAMALSRPGTIQAGARHLDCPNMNAKKGASVSGSCSLRSSRSLMHSVTQINISDAFETYGESSDPIHCRPAQLLFLCRRVRGWEDQ